MRRLPIPGRGAVKCPAVAKMQDLSLTPIHHAAIRGKVRILKLLLKKGNPNLEKKDRKGRTALHHAVKKGHLEAVEVLLANGALVDAKNEASFTPLTFAVRDGKLEIVELLLGNGASVTPLCSLGGTPLHYAAMGGFVEIAKALLNKGAAAGRQDKRCWTALDYAVHGRHWDVVELLLEEGRRRRASSQPQPQDANGPLPAFVDDESVMSALHKGTEACPRTPMQVAAFFGLDNLMHRLFEEQGCHPDGHTLWKPPPLYLAVENGHEACVKLLVTHGADVDHRHGSTREMRLELAQLFGHAVYEQGLAGESSLECAMRLGRDAIAGILRKAGAKPPPDTPLSTAQTMFYDLCEAGFAAKVRSRLQEEGGNEDLVNVAGLRSRTPLHAAAQRGHLEVVKLLVDHGADMNAKTFFGSTAEKLAEKFDRSAVAAFLKKAREEATERAQATGGNSSAGATQEEPPVERDQSRRQTRAEEIWNDSDCPVSSQQILTFVR
ncbi:hypothetical protein MAPG_06003 [Magnaporthiopsis poae ATCC 64411]|uniref:Uncharacterized protein n=1 Tax=Magnaporthiopsis poae (strain ATCC 64411 / 73-15) TaxID=644358 RepID=A0A0C4E0W5_MAGP6|nr:hypothetical protein MAPG_06003 [Magnaporthiopsis poae ATCC 64411]